MKKIVVIGSLNMDLITQTDKVPRIGETVTGTGFKTAGGGKGANQACAAAKLGADVIMLGNLGRDIFGDEILDNLSTAGVDCKRVMRRDDCTTGTAAITVSGGDNSIIIIPGANGKVSREYIDENMVVIKDAGMIILQLEIPIDTVEYVTGIASDLKIPVIFNPAPAVKISPSVFKGLDYLVVNETECSFYCGRDISSVEDAMAKLADIKRDLGVRNVLITLGDKGTVYNDSDEIIHEPARKVKAVDSTAAGDTFIGAFASKIMDGSSIRDAVSFATRASAIAVTRMGAQTSIPYKKEVEEYIF